jgi:Phytanoyl-CoA dioxygenase (PhyH)
MDRLPTNEKCKHRSFERDGFSILPGVLATPVIGRLIDSLSEVADERGVRSRGGVYAIRNLLDMSPAIKELAFSAKIRSIVEETLKNSAWPVRAIRFDKTGGANWLVPWHQDLTICVGARLEVPGYGPWTMKAGVWHVQPPASILERMLSVRIHLDDCPESNGALRVLPGTHRLGRLTAVQIAEQQRVVPAVSCVVDAGGAVLMRSLLLHASSAASEVAHRRVVHIDYAPLSIGGRFAVGDSVKSIESADAVSATIT